MAEPSANENPRVFVGSRLGQCIKKQRIGVDLDIEIGPLDRLARIAQDRALKDVVLAQWLEALIAFEVFAHVQGEMLATDKGQFKDRT